MAGSATAKVTSMLPRSWQPTVIVTAGISVLMASHTLNRQWSGDAEAHMAAITEMAARPWSADEPFIGGDIDSPYFSPWTLAWGVIARATTLTAPEVLVLSGLVNLVLILLALQLFARELGANSRTVAWTLASTVVLWGIATWRWSGFVSLNSLGFMLPYPSGAGFALMLLGWILTLRILTAPTPSRTLGLVLILAFLALSHPFTAFNTGLGIVALIISRSRSARPVLVIAISAATAVALAVTWPYYSLIEAAAGGGEFDAAHATFYEPSAVLRLCLLLVALPPLALRWRDSHRDPLVLLTGLGAIVYLLGWVIGMESLGRVIPVLVLGPQLAVAFALGQGLPASPTRSWRWATLAALVVGLIACTPGLTRSIPAAVLPGSVEESLRFRESPRWVPFEDLVEPGQTVLVQNDDLAAGWIARGTRVVAAPYPQPFIQDSETRRTATQEFFAEDFAGQRSTIQRYNVTWVVWDEASFAVPDGWPVERRAEGWALMNADVWRSAKYES